MNENKKNSRPQVAPFSVSTSVDEELFLQNLVEKLAHRRADAGATVERIPFGLSAISTSSIEAHISGNLDITAGDAVMSIPYTTCFAFSCTRPRRGEYSLQWISSLS